MAHEALIQLDLEVRAEHMLAGWDRLPPKAARTWRRSSSAASGCCTWAER